MLKRFIESVWFNILLAVLAAVLIIMQEVWIGTEFMFAAFLALGVAAAFGFSWGASVISYLAYHAPINWKRIWIGFGVGSLAALLTVLLV